jgi:hypothetical protein
MARQTKAGQTQWFARIINVRYSSIQKRRIVYTFVTRFIALPKHCQRVYTNACAASTYTHHHGGHQLVGNNAAIYNPRKLPPYNRQSSMIERFLSSYSSSTSDNKSFTCCVLLWREIKEKKMKRYSTPPCTENNNNERSRKFAQPTWSCDDDGYQQAGLWLLCLDEDPNRAPLLIYRHCT